MGEFVRVDSVDKLKEFRVALCAFTQTASTALDEARSEVHRTIIWLKQDRYGYWKKQVSHCTERFAKARQELRRKKDIETSPLGGTYSFIDERKALAAAQRALEQAEQKFKQVQHWIIQLEQESHTFKGLIQGLAGVVEVEIPNARAQMDRMIDSLEAYVALRPPSSIAADGTEQPGDMSLVAGYAEPLWHLDCQKLRAKTPPPAVRSQTKPGDPGCNWFCGNRISKSLREAIAGIIADRLAVSSHQKVLITKSAAGEHCRLYLERTGSDSPGDSGWYIGTIDDREIHDYEGIRIADLLEMRPDLGEILDLPAGYLIVLNGDSVEAVFDPNNELVQLEHR